MSVTPEFIVQQRALGWPDIHPEDYCHRCGRPNPCWFSPEFVSLVGSYSGIMCPSCFAALDPDPTAVWCFTRTTRTTGTSNLQSRLAAILSGCLNDPSDADRLAGCIVQAGWRPGPAGDKQ